MTGCSVEALGWLMRARESSPPKAATAMCVEDEGPGLPVPWQRARRAQARGVGVAAGVADGSEGA